jgi:[NiFe] hydrogenase diaphorase moiety large subunit
VFSAERNILEIVEYYMSFFVHESCGYCTPCRVGNVFLQKAIAKFRAGQGEPERHRLPARPVPDNHRDEPLRPRHDVAEPDPVDAGELPAGLFGGGQTGGGRLRATFDIQSAISDARHLAKRRSYIFDKDFSA